MSTVTLYPAGPSGPATGVDLGEAGSEVTNYGPGAVSYSDAAEPFVAEGTIAASSTTTLYGTQFFRATTGAVIAARALAPSVGSGSAEEVSVEPFTGIVATNAQDAFEEVVADRVAADAVLSGRIDPLEAAAVEGLVTPLGFETLTVTTAVGLPDVPEGADLALITVTVGDVRWRDDGTDPTTLIGQPMTAPDHLTYEGDLDAIKFVAQTGTPATLDVSYYSRVASTHIYRLIEGVDYELEAGATAAVSGFALIYDGVGVGLFGSLETVPVGGALQLITFLIPGWDVGWDAIQPGSIYATMGLVTAYGSGGTVLKPSVTVWPENTGLKMYIESGANEDTILWFQGQRWVPVDPPEV